MPSIAALGCLARRPTARRSWRTPPVQRFVRQYPAVSSPPAASTKARTTAARSAGSASAVASSESAGAGAAGAGGPRPGHPGRAGAAGPRRRSRSTSAAQRRRRRPRSCRPGGRPPVAVQPQPDRRRVLGDVLVDDRVGEPGQRRAGRGRPSTSASRAGPAADGPARAPGARQRRLAGVPSAAHARTPTRTLRNRAGAAGWPVWPIWPGWPLPQFGVPQATDLGRRACPSTTRTAGRCRCRSGCAAAGRAGRS